MKMPIITMCSLLLLAVTAFAQKPPDTRLSDLSPRNTAAEQELMKLERREYRDVLNGKPSDVVSMMASDFVGWDSGTWDGKTHWVPMDKAAASADIVQTSGKAADITVDNLQARVHGDTGVVSGRAVFKQKDGTVFDTHFLDTWVRRDGRWILIAGANFGQESKPK